MGIFNRKSADDHTGATASGSTRAGADGRSEAGSTRAGARSETVDKQQDSGVESSARARLSARTDGTEGPFDRSAVTDSDVENMLDLGALLVSPIPESELRLDVDEEGQTVTGVTAVVGDSALQLQVFAAPKSSGVWDGIRREIADNLLEAGGTADEHDGSLGLELHARMPARGADGTTTYTPVRFIGVDGPRWFLRGVLTGRAAVEEPVADQLLEFARTAVIDRGTEARAPRELLSLTLPPELTQQAQQAEGDDLRPFERGPEITEVR